jgi:hypothetical protein
MRSANEGFADQQSPQHSVDSDCVREFSTAGPSLAFDRRKLAATKAGRRILRSFRTVQAKRIDDAVLA